MYCVGMLLDMHTFDFLNWMHNLYLQSPRLDMIVFLCLNG